MIALYIAAAAVLLYAVFIVGPAFTAAHFIFAKMAPLGSDGSKDDPRFTPYLGEMIAAYDFIESKNPRRVEITARDGTRLGADLVVGTSDRVVVFCHGYRASPKINFPIQGRMMAENGYSLLFIRQRGHDGSGGKNSTLGLLEGDDIIKWTEYARETLGAKKIVVYGLSMGAFAVSSVADRFDPESVTALVVDSGYSSPKKQLMTECGRRRLPGSLMMPWIGLYAKAKFGVSIRKSAPDALRRASVPVFFIHGKEDRTVPLSEGTENFGACASEKEMAVPETGQHGVAFPAGGAELKEKLLSFLDKANSRQEL